MFRAARCHGVEDVPSRFDRKWFAQQRRSLDIPRQLRDTRHHDHLHTELVRPSRNLDAAKSLAEFEIDESQVVTRLALEQS